MATEIILPRVDMDMTTGQISRWFFEEGASVVKGQVLFEIETDKAAMEIDAAATGILTGRAPTGAQVPVGSIVGWIASPGEVFEPSVATKPAQQQQLPAAAPAAKSADLAAPMSELAPEGTRATPPCKAAGASKSGQSHRNWRLRAARAHTVSRHRSAYCPESIKTSGSRTAVHCGSNRQNPAWRCA